MKGQMTRRDVLKGLGLAAGASLLGACAAGGTPQAQSPAQEAIPQQVTPPTAATGVVRLRLSAWADVQDAVVYQKMVNTWHAKQQEIVAVVEQYPGGYYQKIQANFAAGDPADVLYYQGWMWQAYAEDGLLTPLDDFIQATEMQERFPQTENYIVNTQWHGHTYMTPTDVGSLVVYYNKDLFDKRGLRYPQKGWTWEEFQEAVQKLSFVENGQRFYGWAQAGGWNGTYARNINFIRRNGYLEWDRVVEPTKALWEHEDVISALQFIVYDAIANQWSPAPDVVQGGGVGVDTGLCAMVLEGPWYMPRLWGELATTPTGINYDVVEPPVGRAGKNFNFAHIHGHTITAACKNKEAAWKLIQFILSEEGQQIIAEGGRMCGTPDLIDRVWAPIATTKYNFTNSEAFSNGMREGATPFILGKGTDMNAYGGGPITSLWDALLGLQMTAEEAIRHYNPEIQAELDRYWAARQ